MQSDLRPNQRLEKIPAQRRDAGRFAFARAGDIQDRRRGKPGQPGAHFAQAVWRAGIGEMAWPAGAGGEIVRQRRPFRDIEISRTGQHQGRVAVADVPVRALGRVG